MALLRMRLPQSGKAALCVRASRNRTLGVAAGYLRTNRVQEAGLQQPPILESLQSAADGRGGHRGSSTTAWKGTGVLPVPESLAAG